MNNPPHPLHNLRSRAYPFHSHEFGRFHQFNNDENLGVVVLDIENQGNRARRNPHNFQLHPELGQANLQPNENMSEEEQELRHRAANAVTFTQKCCQVCICFTLVMIIFMPLLFIFTNTGALDWFGNVVVIGIIFLFICTLCGERQTSQYRSRRHMNRVLMEQMITTMLILEQRRRMNRAHAQLHGDRDERLQNIREVLRNMFAELGIHVGAGQQGAQAGLSAEQINGLPVEVYNKEKVEGQEEESCSICLCEFEKGDELRKLPCRHHFHKMCIDEWLQRASYCPNCKGEIGGQQQQQQE